MIEKLLISFFILLYREKSGNCEINISFQEHHSKLICKDFFTLKIRFVSNTYTKF